MAPRRQQGGYRAGPISNRKQAAMRRPNSPGLNKRSQLPTNKQQRTISYGGRPGQGGDTLPSFDPDGSPPGPGPSPTPFPGAGEGRGPTNRFDRGPTPGLGYGRGGRWGNQAQNKKEFIRNNPGMLFGGPDDGRPVIQGMQGGLPKGYNKDPRTPVKSTGLPYGVSPGSTPIPGSNGYGFYGPGVGPDNPWSPTNVGGYGGPEGGDAGILPGEPRTPTPAPQNQPMNTGAYNQAPGSNKKWNRLQDKWRQGTPQDQARIRQMMMKQTNYNDGTPADSEIATWLKRQKMNPMEQDQQRIRTLTQGLGGKLADPMSNYNLNGGEFGTRGQGLMAELGGLLGEQPDYQFNWNNGGPNSRAETNEYLGIGSPSEIWKQLFPEGYGQYGGGPGETQGPPPWANAWGYRRGPGGDPRTRLGRRIRGGY